MYKDIVYSNLIIYLCDLENNNPKSVASSQSCKTDNLDNPRGESRRDIGRWRSNIEVCVCVCVCVCAFTYKFKNGTYLIIFKYIPLYHVFIRAVHVHYILYIF